MKILITGVSGFIGSRIAEHLLAHGHELYCLLRRNPSEALKTKFDSRVRFLGGSLEDSQFLEAICAGKNLVIHCAGQAGTWGAREGYWQANVELTKRLAEAASVQNVPKWIQLSSPSIYFEDKDLFKLPETYLPQKFSSFYAESKWAADKLLFEGNYSFKTIALRPRFVLGRGDLQIIPRLTRYMKKGVFLLLGKGDSDIDVTNVANICLAVECCLAAPENAWNEIYNITNGSPISVTTLFEALQKRASKKVSIIRIPAPVVMQVARGFERVEKWSGYSSANWPHPVEVAVMNRSMTLNIEKAKEKLGYKPDPYFLNALNEYTE